MNFLNPLEVAVLMALKDGRWHSSVEIARDADQPAYAVRGALQELKRRRLVHRGFDIEHVGTWATTPSGAMETVTQSQLRLV